MPLSEKTRNRLYALIAISPIVRKFGPVGLVGLILAVVGLWRNSPLLAVAGAVLAAPIIWTWIVIAFIFPLFVLWEKFRRHTSNDE